MQKKTALNQQLDSLDLYLLHSDMSLIISLNATKSAILFDVYVRYLIDYLNISRKDQIKE